jgi:DNA invertase Pin-like site-specific DNA recombinase
MPATEITGAKDRRPGIEFVSLSESLDTATPAGRMVFNVLGAPVAFAS